MISGKFILKIQWLWFILTLFIMSMPMYPMLKWIQRRKRGLPITCKEDGMAVVGYVVAVLFICIFSILKTKKDYRYLEIPNVILFML